MIFALTFVFDVYFQVAVTIVIELCIYVFLICSDIRD